MSRREFGPFFLRRICFFTQFVVDSFILLWPCVSFVPFSLLLASFWYDLNRCCVRVRWVNGHGHGEQRVAFGILGQIFCARPSQFYFSTTAYDGHDSIRRRVPDGIILVSELGDVFEMEYTYCIRIKYMSFYYYSWVTSRRKAIKCGRRCEFFRLRYFTSLPTCGSVARANVLFSNGSNGCLLGAYASQIETTLFIFLESESRLRDLDDSNGLLCCWIQCIDLYAENCEKEQLNGWEGLCEFSQSLSKLLKNSPLLPKSYAHRLHKIYFACVVVFFSLMSFFAGFPFSLVSSLRLDEIRKALLSYTKTVTRWMRQMSVAATMSTQRAHEWHTHAHKHNSVREHRTAYNIDHSTCDIISLLRICNILNARSHQLLSKYCIIFGWLFAMSTMYPFIHMYLLYGRNIFI